MTVLDDIMDKMAYQQGLSELKQINNSLHNKQYIVYTKHLVRLFDCIEFLNTTSLQDDLYHRLETLQKAYMVKK